MYTLIIAASAIRELDRLPRAVSRRIASRINALGLDPRPRGSIKLSGSENLYRIRAGDYRVLYAVDDSKLLVDVLRVRHRRDAYDQLP